MHKIVCTMAGHHFIHEVQTVAQVFFGQARILIVPAHPNNPSAPLLITTYMDQDQVIATIHQDDVETARCLFLLNEARFMNVGLPPKRIFMLALFHALKKAFPIATPWGALTGIRPTSMVRTWINENKTDETILHILQDTLSVQEDKAQLAITVAHAERQLTQLIYQSTPKEPIAIYIGIPFCPSRCLYCSFNMGSKPSQAMLTHYINTLIHECREKAQQLQPHQVVTAIYIGGGTPTLLSDDLLHLLLSTVAKNFGTPPEYTVEAGRPDTLTITNMQLLRSYGVNRIAINAQTLKNRTLTAIGRGHSAEDFYRAFSQARDVGFTCINTDLIVGLPGEDNIDFQSSLEAILALKPENLTIHALSIKRASALNDLPDNPSIHMPATKDLASHGYTPYYLYRQKNTVNLLENVGYTLPNHACLYNIGMMSEVQTVLGIGAGAVSKYIEGDKITRVFNEKNPEVYLARRDSITPAPNGR